MSEKVYKPPVHPLDVNVPVSPFDVLEIGAVAKAITVAFGLDEDTARNISVRLKEEELGRDLTALVDTPAEEDTPFDNIRAFEPVEGASDVKLPKRATACSAGYDFFSPVTTVIAPKSTVFIKTNVKAIMPDDECLKIYIRSSLAVKNIVLRNGVAIIDADYYDNETNGGNIIIPLYNDGTDDFVLRKGERFAQGIFEKYLTVDGDPAQAPRLSGFGSTGV